MDEGAKERLAQYWDVSPREVSRLLRRLRDWVESELKQGADVQFPGLVSLHVRREPYRVRRNPRSGEKFFSTPRQGIRVSLSGVLRQTVGGTTPRGLLVYAPVGTPWAGALAGLQAATLPVVTVRTVNEARRNYMDQPAALLVIGNATPAAEYRLLSTMHKLQDTVLHPQIIGITTGAGFAYDDNEGFIVPDFDIPAASLAGPSLSADLLRHMMGDPRDIRVALQARLRPDPLTIDTQKTLVESLLRQSLLKDQAREDFLGACLEAIDWAASASRRLKAAAFDLLYEETTEGVVIRLQGEQPLFDAVNPDIEDDRVTAFRRSILNNGTDAMEIDESFDSLTLQRRL